MTATPKSKQPKGSVPALPQRNYAMLNEGWTIADDSYQSPLESNSKEQTIIFAESFKNGFIDATITPIKSQGTRWDGKPSLEAEIIMRYAGQNAYYYAGMGAWGYKFYIAKAIPWGAWLQLGSTGDIGTVHMDTPYRIRMECVGNRISLYENNVRLLEVYDEDYQTGQWGLRTYKTCARFDQINVSVSRPQCFVVMPFAQELEYVYEVIRKVVKEYGIDCTRADELAVSRPVIDDIRAQIAGTDLVIVDFSGRNPNVYFEAGLADAWKKKWIVLAQTTDDLSFDVKHIRTILYSNRMGADIQLADNLRRAIEETMGLTRRKV